MKVENFIVPFCSEWSFHVKYNMRWLTISQFNNSNMSDHHDMSGQSSLDKNFQIRTNNDGENELYIPCWEEQGSNSTQYQHLIEETKFFKNKCKHLENHLEENHREFSSLNQLYLIAETNERRLLKENEDLRKANRELIGELSSAKVTIDTTSSELHASAKRQSQFRQKYFKTRDRQTELQSEIEGLRSQYELLKRRSTQQGHGTQQQKWKRYYNEQLTQIAQMKAAAEEFELQFDKKSKQVREKNEQIKNLNKAFNANREDYELKIRGLEGDLEEIRRQLSKAKSAISDYQRQIKEIKLVRDEVSTKNDQIEAQNSRLKRLLKQQTSKYQRLDTLYQQLILVNEELANTKQGLVNDANNSKSMISELRTKLANQQKQINETRTEKDKILISKSQIDSAYASLQKELAQFRRQKESELSSLSANYQAKMKNLKDMSNKQRLENQSQLSALKKTISKKEEQNIIIHQQLQNYKIQLDRLNIKYQEHLSKSNYVQNCGHEDQINELRQELKRITQQKEEFKSKSLTSAKLIEDINIQLQNLRLRNQQMSQQNERNTREKIKLLDERQKLLSEKSRLALSIRNIEEQKNTLTRENTLLSQDKSKGYDESQIRSFEFRIKQKQKQIQRLARANRELEQQIQAYQSRSKQEAKDTEKTEREKNKRYEAKIKQKERQIRQLEDKLEQMENSLEEERNKLKTIEKDNRTKQNQLNKKEKKVKEHEKNISELMKQLEQLQVIVQNNKTQIQSIKRQLKGEQTANQKLKVQIQRHNSQKQNWQRQQVGRYQKNHERQRHEWQQQHRKFTQQLKIKDEEVLTLKRQIQQLRDSQKGSSSQNVILDGQKQKVLQAKIHQLQQLLKEKQDLLKRYQSSQRTDDDVSSGTLEQLQAEYNRELLALKRLIMYKGYKEEESKRIEQMKNQYETKIQIIMSDYKAMYQELMILKEKLLNQKVLVSSQPVVDMAAVEEIWRVKVEQVSQERQVLIEKVAMWQRKYEELRFLFEAKLESKDQTINLLNLKLNNLEMSRPVCQYSCHHR